MSYTIFDLFGYELMSIKMKDKSFSIEWKKENMHSVLYEDADSEKKYHLRR